MIDTKNISILTLVNTPLKKVAGTGGGEYHGPCPFCGGKDRFIVQPENGRWSCRGCSPNWNDAIEFVKRRDNVGFKEAVETLSLTLPERQQRPKARHASPLPPPPVAAADLRKDYNSFDDEWQQAARSFIDECEDRLWSANGSRALEYLKERHLSENVIGMAGLGYNDRSINVCWGKVEVWLPRGVVIPWEFKGHLWKVNIRRPPGDIKGDKDKRYIQAAGGANGLYCAHTIYEGCTVVLVEGEFDALVLRSQLRCPELAHLVPIATGSAEGARLLRWVSLLSVAETVLMAFDADDAGDKAADWWHMGLPKTTRRLRPIEAKDITDMVKAGVNLRAWLKESL